MTDQQGTPPSGETGRPGQQPVPRPSPPRFPPPAYGARPSAYPPPPTGPAGYPAPYHPALPGPGTAVVAPAAYWTHPHPVPTPYHQMLRTWSYAWWRPLAGLGVLLLGFLAVQVVVAVMFIVLAAAQPGPVWDDLGSLADLDDVGPRFLLLLNLSLGAMILLCWLTIRLVHRMRPRWLTSVAPKMRWRFLWACVGVSVIALIAQLAVFTTPFQAAGEEYLFRGYLMQAIGSLLRFDTTRMGELVSKWGAILLTSLLFAAAHGSQNFPLFFDRFAFGFIAGWLIIRTGGLEAGVAMHILNNFFALGAALLFGDIGSSLSVTETSWWNVPVTLTQAGVYAVLVVLLAQRLGVRSHTQPPVWPTPVQPAAVPA
jgi:CAAX protease family protein